MKSGLFVVLDGNEGCGKSTQIERLRQRIESTGREVLAVRDPGSTRIGEKIRQILLDPDHRELGMRCEMLLYMAARAQLMAELIRPALERNAAVLSDRFVSSTLAYQLDGDGMSFDEITETARVALRGTMPALTIILDLPIEISFERVQAKFEQRRQTLFGDEIVETVKDRIEQRPFEYHARVRENFLMQARRDPARHRVVDASRDAAAVHEDVWKLVEPLLEKSKS